MIDVAVASIYDFGHASVAFEQAASPVTVTPLSPEAGDARICPGNVSSRDNAGLR